MASNRYYIEFVGISGSGKTALADRLNAHLREAGCRVLELPRSTRDTRKPTPRKFPRFRKMLKYYGRNLLCFLEGVFVRFHPKFRYRGNLHTLLKRKYKTEKHFTKDFDFIISHEGTFQFYRTAGHRIDSTDHLPEYHAIFRAQVKKYEPIIINLSVNPQLALKRCSSVRMSVRDPAEWSLSKVPVEEQAELLASWSKKKERIMELVRREGIHVIEVSTETDVETSFHSLITQLAPLVHIPMPWDNGSPAKPVRTAVHRIPVKTKSR